MATTINAAIHGPGHAPQPVPTVLDTLEHLLDTCHTAIVGPVNFQSRNAVIEAVASSMVLNPSRAQCRDGRVSRFPNRMALNALIDLVAYSRDHQAAVVPYLSNNAAAFLASLQNGNTLRRHIICEWNEGSRISNNPNSANLCSLGAKSTVGNGNFSRSLTQCPCKDQGQCTQSPICQWVPNANGNGNGVCISNVHPVGARFGSRYRTMQNVDWSNYRRNQPVLLPNEVTAANPAGFAYAAGPHNYFTLLQ